MSQPSKRRTLSAFILTAVLSLSPLSEAMAAPSRSAGFKARIGSQITSLWQTVSRLSGLTGLFCDVGSRWDPNGLD